MTAGAYGYSTWGGLSVTTGLSSVLPIGPRVLQVDLDSPPLAASAFGASDALNPDVWSLVRQDTSESYIIASVTRVTPTRFRLQLIAALGGPTVTHRLGAYTLRSPVGVLATAPRYLDFQGPAFAPFAPPEQLNRPIDIASAGVGAAFRIGPTGDYVQHSGAELVRKLIIRRIVTVRGSFRHLPNYGFGIQPKGFINDTILFQLRSEIERVVLKEPEVVSARVKLTRSAQGVLHIYVTAQTRLQDLPIQIVLPFNPGVAL